MVDRLNGLFFSEFVVDNPEIYPGYDTDGDGTQNKSDEYIEIQNTSGSTMSLDGYQVWSDDRGLLYSFDASDTIAAGETAVIIGEYTGSAPANYFEAGLSEGDDFLQDGQLTLFDSIYLVDTATGEYIVFSYGIPVPTPSPPTGFPGTTQLGTGESLLSDGPNGVAFVREAGGTWTEGPYTPGTPGVPCFTTGTMILTPDGARAIETLQVGDMVSTHNGDPQPIRWIASRTFGAKELAATPDLRPIRLDKKWTRANCDMLLSPQHAVMVTSARFPEGRLARAIQLSRLMGGAARVAEGTASVTYVHLMLPQHALIYANGIAAETFYPGMRAINALSPTARVSLRAQFPDVEEKDYAFAYGPPVADYARAPEFPRRLSALSTVKRKTSRVTEFRSAA